MAKPNSKFCKGSKKWADRQTLLAKILERILQGKSFSDLQSGV